MRVSTQSVVKNLVANLERSYERMTRFQRELSTGTRINNPSDDPSGTQRSLALRVDIRENEQFRRNIREAKGWLNMTETSLAHVEEVLLSVQSLASQGASTLISPTERQILADSVDQAAERVLDLSRTTLNGKFIFGGTDTTNDPFIVTRNTDGRIVSIQISPTAAGSVEREITDGVRIQINTPPDAVFGGTLNPLNSLIELRNRLVNSDVEGVGAVAGELETVRRQVTDVRGSVGSKTSRIDMTENVLSRLITDLQSVLSETEDVNIAEHVMNLRQEENVYQAALMTASNILPPTLEQFLR
ncbi:MAG: flagellar hook-associated protein FlgL [Candidatus Latescibacteria bacterium]|nr:flagellar hook-associated protein FlgL [Candidatus Latescibacterota bacterium]